MKKSILLKGWYGQHNLGDDLLFLTNLSFIPDSFSIYVQKGPYIEEFLRYRDFKIIDHKNKNYRPSIILYGGGGLFPTRRYELSFKNKIHLLLEKFKVKHKIMFGVGVVPKTDKKSEKNFRYFLKGFDYISVRDNTSKDYVNDLLNTNIKNIGDLYFTKPLSTKQHVRNNRLLVCLANPFNKKELSDAHYQNRIHKLIKQLSTLIESVSGTFDGVDFLPFYDIEDTNISKLVIKELDVGISVKILQRNVDFSLENVDDIFSHYRIGICMRFHSIVLSIRNSLPMLPICYDYKSIELVKECGIESYCLTYGIRETEFFGKEFDIQTDEMIEKMGKVINNLHQIAAMESQTAEKINFRATEELKKVMDRYLK